MRFNYWLTLAVAGMMLFSCKKEKAKPAPDPIPVEPVLLKEIVIPNLPSPYYHLAYNSSDRIINISFSSGFRMYNVVYNGTRITELANNTVPNKDRMQYQYDAAGRPGIITYINKDGQEFRRCFLTYTGDQLRLAEWEQKVNAGFAAERTVSFVYQADGNLLEMTNHLHPVPGQTEATYVSRFEQYDNKLCTDDFTLLHENDEHLLWLPGVRFQKNNPGRLLFSGNGGGFTIDYTYTYNEKNAPLVKTGQAEFTSGPNAGLKWQVNHFYSYYQ